MVNLPIKKNLAPIASTASSVTNIMNDLKTQQKNMATLVHTISSVGNGFSDDLVDLTTKVDAVMTQTSNIVERIDKQQQVLASIQTKNNPASAELVKTLSSEIVEMKSAASAVSSHAAKITSIVENGISASVADSKVMSQLNSVAANFSNTASKLTSSLESHSKALGAIVASSEKLVSGGLIGDAISKVSSVQSMISGAGIGDLTSKLGDLGELGGDLKSITRESMQKFTDISEQVSSQLENLKGGLVTAISSKITAKSDLFAIAGDLEGALSQAAEGLNKLQNPLSMLPDVESALGDIKNAVSGNIGAIASDITTGFTDQLGQITDVVSSMSSLGSNITGQIGNLTSTISSSFDNVGGLDAVTGAIGGVSSLTEIASPAAALSESLTDMANLGRTLTVSASNLSQMASSLPPGNTIEVFSSQISNIGESLYKQTLNTPAELDSLVKVVSDPAANLSALEKTISNTGSDLTNQIASNISLPLDPEKMSKDLTSQILTVSNKIGKN